MYHVRAQGVDERMINVHYYCVSVCVRPMRNRDKQTNRQTDTDRHTDEVERELCTETVRQF